MEAFIEDVLKGDILAASRLLRAVDDQNPKALKLLEELYPKRKPSQVIGFTGPPGVGKSTLIDALISKERSLGKRIGVLAIDPSSPFSGGAILGDRIRMSRHTSDPGVFIRSLASRGRMGGLSASVQDSLVVMQVMGFNPILVETVGTGQDEVDVLEIAHTVLLVLAPGLGDVVQSLKAGIMEIADIYVINKADRESARSLQEEIEEVVAMKSYGPEDWRAKAILASPLRGEGLDELQEAIRLHWDFLKQQGLLQEKEAQITKQLVLTKLKDRMSCLLEARLGRILEDLKKDGTLHNPYGILELLYQKLNDIILKTN
jgi:LAO/AO transport system kinase